VGNLRDYEDDRLGFLLAARDNYGDVVAFDDRTTIVNSGRLAQQVLLNRDSVFELHENFLQEPWKPRAAAEAHALRRHLNPGLRPGAARGIIPLLARRVDDELATWPRSGSQDPLPAMERAITASVAEFYFGADGAALAPLLTGLLDALSRTILDPLVLPWRSIGPARREIRRRHREVARHVTRLLQERLERPPLDDFASLLLRHAVEECAPARLADLVIGSMLAGQRVPAAAACWLLLLVARSPRHAPALSREAELLDDALASGSSHEVTLRRLPLATACVLETLRLYPTTWLITRRSNRPVDLGRYSFATGHNFFLSPYVIHRDEREFPDALAFVPERWTAGRTPSGAFLPFGHGEHVCPGRHLAVLVLAVALLRSVTHGGLVPAPCTVVPDPRTTLVPDGLRLALPGAVGARAATPSLGGGSSWAAR
jgi:unspecific monooxygenase